MGAGASFCLHFGLIRGILELGSAEKSADFLVPIYGRKFMNKEKTGIGSVLLQQGTGKPGTFLNRRDDAIKKGHVSSSDTQVQAIRRFQEEGVGEQNPYKPSFNI